jgi:hypothetical protein
MSQLHPTEEDEEMARANSRQGLMMRVEWVKKLRACLERFAYHDGQTTHEDIERARQVLNETKEWL